MRKIY